MKQIRGVMEISEEVLNEIVAGLIAKHFPGLKTRAVRIDNSIKEFARADEPNMIFNASLHRSLKDVKETITHELIHYELGDSGKYFGHGRDFKRRAKQLGIFGRIEFLQCSTGEEILSQPHRTEVVKIPRKEFGEQIINAIKKLKKIAARAPMKLQEQIYREAQSIEATWVCYEQAVEHGDDFVLEERVQLRRGPKGKSLEVLLKERKELESRVKELFQQLENGKDRKMLAELRKCNRRLSWIDETIEQNFS